MALFVTLGGSGPPTDSAASMIKISLEQLTTRADTIVVGTVTNQVSTWNSQRTAIHTNVTVGVETVVKGPARQEVSFQIAGGTVGGTTMRTSNDPVFQNGERVIVFLNTAATPASIVGLHQGKYSIKNETVIRDGQTFTIDDFLNVLRGYLIRR
jgi:hypothetical protein